MPCLIAELQVIQLKKRQREKVVRRFIASDSFSGRARMLSLHDSDGSAGIVQSAQTAYRDEASNRAVRETVLKLAAQGYIWHMV
jgi:hypothetical protein